MAAKKSYVNGVAPVPESTLLIRRSWRSLWFHFLVFLLIVWVGSWISFSVPQSILVQEFIILGSNVELRLPLVCLLATFAIIRPLFLMRDTCHRITPHHIHSTTGLWSWKTRRVEIAFEDLLDVEVDQHILGRIIGYGDIRIGAADVPAHEIVMRGICHPERFVSLISERIDHARMERRVPPVTRVIRELEAKVAALAASR